jgi:hypothetical protein
VLGPLPEDLSVEGIYGYTSSNGLWMSTNCLYLKCREDSTLPSDGIYSGFNSGVQYTIPSNARGSYKYLWFPRTRLRKGHSYHFTFDGSGGSFSDPYYGIIEDPSAGLSDFLASMQIAGMPCFGVVESGSDWVTYNNTTDGVRSFGLAPILAEHVNFPRALVGIR